MCGCLISFLAPTQPLVAMMEGLASIGFCYLDFLIEKNQGAPGSQSCTYPTGRRRERQINILIRKRTVFVV